MTAARPGRLGQDEGSAIIEFIFVAVLVMVPMIYLIVAVASVQRDQLAVTNAAREAGRAYASADSADQAPTRAGAAARIAFTDAGLPDAPDIRIVAPGAACTSAAVEATLDPGAEFTVCVVRHSALPAIPSILQGRGVTTEGRYVVHVDDFRTTT